MITHDPPRTWPTALWQGLILTVVMYSALGGYLLVLHWRGHEPLFITHLPIDDIVPFQPGWVWVYMLPYVLAPIVIGSLHRSVFVWFLRRAVTVVAIALLIFLWLPTQTAPRPSGELEPGPTTWVYQQMVAIDNPPANAAPSLHISLATLLALALWIDFPRYRLVALLAIGAVGLATLFTRQHHLIDVVTGMALAALVVWWKPYRRPGEAT